MILDVTRLLFLLRANLASVANKLFPSLLLGLTSSVYLVTMLYFDDLFGVDLGLEAAEVSFIVGNLSLSLLESALVALVLFCVLNTKLRLYHLFLQFSLFLLNAGS